MLLTEWFSYHIGKNQFGVSFADWHPNWDKEIKEKFIAFYKESAESESKSKNNYQIRNLMMLGASRRV